jgi:hypothetical protein
VFLSSNVVLLLNKFDLFREAIAKGFDLSTVFPKFQPSKGEIVTSCLEFVQQKFRKLNRRTGREVFVHTTTIMDTDQIRIVFNAIKDTLVCRTLCSGGLEMSFDMPSLRPKQPSPPSVQAKPEQQQQQQENDRREATAKSCCAEAGSSTASTRGAERSTAIATRTTHGSKAATITLFFSG